MAISFIIALILAVVVWLIGPQAVINMLAIAAFVMVIILGALVLERGP